eukprot:6199946-Pyramimonas_sp.AAC.1
MACIGRLLTASERDASRRMSRGGPTHLQGGFTHLQGGFTHLQGGFTHLSGDAHGADGVAAMQPVGHDGEGHPEPKVGAYLPSRGQNGPLSP